MRTVGNLKTFFIPGLDAGSGALSKSWSFLTDTAGMTFTRSGDQTFTDFEGLVKTVPTDVAAHPGARIVRNLNTTTDLGAWSEFNSGSGSITDNGDGSVTLDAPLGSDRVFIYKTITLAVGSYVVAVDAVNITLGDDGEMFGKGGGTATWTISNDNRLGDTTDKRIAGQIEVTMAGTIVLRVGHGAAGTNDGVQTISNLMIEEVTGQYNQAPSDYVESLEYLDTENGNSIDSAGIVTAGTGLSIPRTDASIRMETNLFGRSDWLDAFTSPAEYDGATAVVSEDGRTATFTNPGGGRAFIGTTFDFESGKTYCMSCRVDIQSGAAGSKENMVAYTTSQTGARDLNFPSSGLVQLIFTTTVTESKLIRFGIGVNGSESVASTIVITEPVIRDVTGMANQNAPTGVIDNTTAFTATNENTVSSNLVTEVAGSIITPIRAYNSGVMFGDSFTNDDADLGSNLPGLAGVAFSTQGVAGYTLPQIGAVLAGHTFNDSDDFVLLEGGINDIIQASTDPFASMSAEKLSQVEHVKSLGMQYLVYTIAPFKNSVDWTAEKQAWADAYNAWVITTFDPRRVVDMYSILEDPANADELLPAYDSGDGLHPNAAGHLATDTATAPLLSPEFMQGILLDGVTDLTTAYNFPSNNISGHIKARPQFEHDSDKGADVVLLDASDGTANNYLRITYDQTNDQIHLKKRVSGTEVVASTTATNLSYSSGDQLNIRFRADAANGISLIVNGETIVTVAAGDANTAWSTTLDQIELNPSGSAVESLRVWNEAKPDAFLDALT